ncbi:MAG: alpha/beta hydrolase [Pirellulales bacterium]|nr:alpha/beta hydrolase [Pirellulales bacterium]
MNTHMLSRREVLAAGGALLATALPGSHALAAAASQRNDGRIRLADGRWLAYREYGPLQGPLVFYFHGTPGSRLELALCDWESCCSGARVIAVDRPGMGRSSYQCRRRILDWPHDIEQLAAALGYADSRFGIVGMSGGASYAAACAAKIPHRLTHVAMVSGHAPLGACGTCPGNQDKLIELISRRQRLGKVALKAIRRRLDRHPDKVVAKITRKWTAADRQLVLCNPKHYRDLIANMREAVRCGPQGLVTDIHLLACPWGFCLSDIQGVSVSLWQGECDRIVTPSMAHYFHKQIAGSELVIDPQAGHVTMFKNYATEILSRFV